MDPMKNILSQEKSVVEKNVVDIWGLIFVDQRDLVLPNYATEYESELNAFMEDQRRQSAEMYGAVFEED